MAALCRMEYDKTRIGLYFADNASTDSSVELLQKLQQKHGAEFAAFEVMKMGENCGFGAGGNRAAAAGRGEYILFLNLDTEVTPNALAEMKRAILHSEKEYAVFEMRQFPYEHLKYYNPITLETGWASGACMAVRRSAFAETGGFDESFFMYAEDVDLSWHLRALGYKIKYVPAAVVHHCTDANTTSDKPLQMAGNLAGNLALRYKYTNGAASLPKWLAEYERIVSLPAYKGDRVFKEALEAQLARVEQNRKAYQSFYRKKVKGSGQFSPCFEGLHYSFMRAGKFYKNRQPTVKPFFSVIVRTYKRPALLRQTLLALCNQTYQNFEVVVVEDGEQPVAQPVAEEMGARLRIAYHAMRSQNGHCVTGNAGMRLAKGEYLCFLDDDDYFFAEHLEVMASAIQQYPTGRFFAAGAVRALANSDEGSAAQFAPQALFNFAHEALAPMDIFLDNPFPIQAAVFHKSLPQKLGGFDEALAAGYEDWEMWVRFANHTPLRVINKATSIYRTPAAAATAEKRAETLFSNMPQLAEKLAGYTLEVTGRDLLYLRYSPAQVNEAVSHLTQKRELVETAQAVANARIWRATAVLRKIGRGVAKPFCAFAALWGPKEPADFETASEQELQQFIKQARSSASWRLFTFFTGRRGK